MTESQERPAGHNWGIIDLDNTSHIYEPGQIGGEYVIADENLARTVQVGDKLMIKKSFSQEEIDRLGTKEDSEMYECEVIEVDPEKQTFRVSVDILS